MFGVLQRTEALTLLRSYVGADDWLALLLKDHVTGEAVQWVGSLRRACSDRTQAWICERNAAGYGVFASVNALSAGARSRRKADIAAVRHVLLDVDRDAHKVLASLKVRQAIPPPTCVVHTSPGRVHVLWRIRECDVDAVERIQKGLALSFGGDPAATSVAQVTRLPGFRNHKYATPYVVWVDYLDVEHVYTRATFRQWTVLSPSRRGQPKRTGRRSNTSVLPSAHRPICHTSRRQSPAITVTSTPFRRAVGLSAALPSTTTRR